MQLNLVQQKFTPPEIQSTENSVQWKFSSLEIQSPEIQFTGNLVTRNSVHWKFSPTENSLHWKFSSERKLFLIRYSFHFCFVFVSRFSFSFWNFILCFSHQYRVTKHFQKRSFEEQQRLLLLNHLFLNSKIPCLKKPMRVRSINLFFNFFVDSFSNDHVYVRDLDYFISTFLCTKSSCQIIQMNKKSFYLNSNLDDSRNDH